MFLNEDRALPAMIQNVVMALFKSIFMLFLKLDANFDENQLVRSYGTQTRTHYLDFFRTRFRVLRSLPKTLGSDGLFGEIC